MFITMRQLFVRKRSWFLKTENYLYTKLYHNTQMQLWRLSMQRIFLFFSLILQGSVSTIFAPCSMEELVDNLNECRLGRRIRFLPRDVLRLLDAKKIEMKEVYEKVMAGGFIKDIECTDLASGDPEPVCGAFSPCGARLALGMPEGVLEFWDLNKEVLEEPLAKYAFEVGSDVVFMRGLTEGSIGFYLKLKDEYSFHTIGLNGELSEDYKIVRAEDIPQQNPPELPLHTIFCPEGWHYGAFVVTDPNNNDLFVKVKRAFGQGQEFIEFLQRARYRVPRERSVLAAHFKSKEVLLILLSDGCLFEWDFDAEEQLSIALDEEKRLRTPVFTSVIPGESMGTAYYNKKRPRDPEDPNVKPYNISG
jgi:hypothetical protein